MCFRVTCPHKTTSGGVPVALSLLYSARSPESSETPRVAASAAAPPALAPPLAPRPLPAAADSACMDRRGVALGDEDGTHGVGDTQNHTLPPAPSSRARSLARRSSTSPSNAATSARCFSFSAASFLRLAASSSTRVAAEACRGGEAQRGAACGHSHAQGGRGLERTHRELLGLVDARAGFERLAACGLRRLLLRRQVLLGLRRGLIGRCGGVRATQEAPPTTTSLPRTFASASAALETFVDRASSDAPAPVSWAFAAS